MNRNTGILITDGESILGLELIRAFLRDSFTNIYAIGSPKSSLPAEVHWLDMDLRNIFWQETIWSEIDTVIHSNEFLSFYQKDKKKIYDQQVKLTRELLDLSIYFNVKNFVYLSSVLSLSRSVNPTQLMIDGEGEPFFYSNYARSKYEAELEVWRASAEGLNSKILNVGFCIEDPSVQRIISHMREYVNSGWASEPMGTICIDHAVNIASKCVAVFQEDLWNHQTIISNELQDLKKLISSKKQPTNSGFSDRLIKRSLKLWSFLSYQLVHKEGKLNKEIIEFMKSPISNISMETRSTQYVES
ncbi:MAG: NAD-dependent epimerase/dehydratase family protein [Bacteroidota bacterium]|nr:NAD-dependent epimerase/dehydratase family protein [Bacteroidota bacterium]